jgi:hypothetical protein
MYQVFGYPHPYNAKNWGGFGNVIVDMNSPQTWLGYCENRNWVTPDNCRDRGFKWYDPYYPVLPKINIKGEFDETLGLMGESPFEQASTEWIPFGSPNITWNEDDQYAPVTSTPLTETWLDYTVIDLDFSDTEDNAINDNGPNSLTGILIDDYMIDYTMLPKIETRAQKPTIKTKLGKDIKGKAY